LARIKKGTWERSITIDEKGNEYRADPNRTSSTMSANSVLNPSDLASIKNSVSRLTGYSCFDIEPDLTIVGYGPGQFFGPHHDAGTVMKKNGSPYEETTSPTSIDIANLVVAIPDPNGGYDQPIRVVSMFVYLNDHQAGTQFPFLRVTTEAKAGKCILFCNYSTTLMRLDPRSTHAGLRLQEDAAPKYGLNIFVRQAGEWGAACIREIPGSLDGLEPSPGQWPPASAPLIVGRPAGLARAQNVRPSAPAPAPLNSRVAW